MSIWIFPTTGTLTQCPTFTLTPQWPLMKEALILGSTLKRELLAFQSPIQTPGITQVSKTLWAHPPLPSSGLRASAPVEDQVKRDSFAEGAKVKKGQNFQTYISLPHPQYAFTHTSLERRTCLVKYPPSWLKVLPCIAHPYDTMWILAHKGGPLHRPWNLTIMTLAFLINCESLSRMLHVKCNQSSYVSINKLIRNIWGSRFSEGRARVE